MKYFVLFCLVLFLFSCHSPHNKNIPPVVNLHSKTSLTGEVIEKMLCKTNSEFRYSLYLPTTYDTSKKWPVIFFFDPHADGKLPLHMYKTLAEKYGFILIGSNNSKNGLSSEASNKLVATIIPEVLNSYSINQARIYMAGFSGGARVASSIALSNKHVAGVIACGAGLSQQTLTRINSLSFIGLVGEADFNYLEMQRLHEQLDKLEVRNQLITFDGKHEWPPENIMKQAFWWLLIISMENKHLEKNEDLLKELKTFFDSEIENKKGLSRLNCAKKAVNYLEKLSDVSSYKKTVESLISSAAVLKEVEQNKSLEKEEQKTQQQFMEALIIKDMTWWKNEFLNLQKKEKEGNTQNQAKRLIAYLSMVSYMYSSSAVKQGNINAAEKFVGVYELVDSSNSEHAYMRAQIEAKKNNYEKTVKYLNRSIELGFKDKKRIEEEIDFKPIYKTEELEKILNKLQE